MCRFPHGIGDFLYVLFYGNKDCKGYYSFGAAEANVFSCLLVALVAGYKIIVGPIATSTDVHLVTMLMKKC